MAAADYREEAILQRFADIHGNLNYVIDRFTSLTNEVARGQSVRVPNIAALAVEDDGAVRVDGASRQKATAASLQLTVNQHPWIPVQIDTVDQVQGLGGQYMNQIADQSLTMLRVHIDALVLDTYLSTSLINHQSAYHFNPAVATLAPSHILAARGLAMREKGTQLSNLLLVMDPLATAAAMAFTGWREVESSTTFGASMVARIYGIPVVETQGVRLQKSFTITAGSVTSSVQTLVFGSSPGLVVGSKVSTSGLQTGYDLTEAPVLTVSGDGLTVTFATAQGDDADILAGGGPYLASDESAWNLLIDTGNVWTAMQLVPSTRIVPDPETTGDILQVSSLLGYIARNGRVRVIHSKADDI